MPTLPGHSRSVPASRSDFRVYRCNVYLLFSIHIRRWREHDAYSSVISTVRASAYCCTSTASALSAQRFPPAMSLSWTDNAGSETGSSINSTFGILGTVGSNVTLSVTNLTPDTRFRQRVVAFNSQARPRHCNAEQLRPSSPVRRIRGLQNFHIGQLEHQHNPCGVTNFAVSGSFVYGPGISTPIPFASSLISPMLKYRTRVRRHVLRFRARSSERGHNFSSSVSGVARHARL